jgi:hypothetical protein
VGDGRFQLGQLARVADGESAGGVSDDLHSGLQSVAEYPWAEWSDRKKSDSGWQVTLANIS